MAVRRQKPAPGPICHTDRGIQYACEPYGKALAAAKISRPPKMRMRVRRSRFGWRAFSSRMSSSSVRQGPIFACGWTLRS